MVFLFSICSALLGRVDSFVASPESNTGFSAFVQIVGSGDPFVLAQLSTRVVSVELIKMPNEMCGIDMGFSILAFVLISSEWLFFTVIPE